MRWQSVLVGMGCAGLTFLFFAGSCSSRNQIDTTFGTSGYVTTDFSGGDDTAVSAALLSDGKIRIAGTTTSGTQTDFAMAQYNTDGSLDTSFGTGGKVTTDFNSSSLDVVNSMTTFSDGSILLAGSTTSGSTTQMALAKYTSTGALDTSFDSDGKMTKLIGSGPDEAISVLVNSDGQIIIVGNFQYSTKKVGVLRMSTDGTLDTNFNTSGVQSFTVTAGTDTPVQALLDSYGRVVVLGNSTNSGVTTIFGTRINTDGSIDTQFGTNGTVTLKVSDLVRDASNNTASAVAFKSDRGILVSGKAKVSGNDQLALFQLSENGVRDSAFGTNGVALLGFTYPNSSSTTPYTLDATGNGLALSSSNDAYVVGQAGPIPVKDMALSRFLSGGILDTTLGTDGRVFVDFSGQQDEARTALVQSDGYVVVIGRSFSGTSWDFALSRFIP